TPASPTTIGATPNSTSSVRGQLGLVLPLPWRTSVFGELEQDIDLPDQHRMAVGGDVQVTRKTRLYGRHENITSFAGPYALNPLQQQATTVVGLSSQEMKDGDVYSEYRLEDAMAGREAQAALGLRNRWALGEGVRLDGGFERLTILKGGVGTATSVSGGLEVTRDPRWKGTARLELRRQADVDRWRATGGGAVKLTRDWAALARTQLGLAFRESAVNRLSGIARYENRQQRYGGIEPSRKTTHIVSTHANWQPV